jgi:hypothetical protein
MFEDEDGLYLENKRTGEVYRFALQSTKNQPPVIISLIANPTTITPGYASTITCTAIDQDGDPLNYTWVVTEGEISGTGPQVTWIAPETWKHSNYMQSV